MKQSTDKLDVQVGGQSLSHLLHISFTSSSYLPAISTIAAILPCLFDSNDAEQLLL